MKLIKNRFYTLLIFSLLLVPVTVFSQDIDDDFNRWYDASQVTLNPSSKKTLDEYLIASIDSNRYDITSYLLLKGANPNCIEVNGFTPLMVASMNRYIEIAELLIKKGANINKKNFRGETNLQWAVFGASMTGNFKVVKLLINNGAYINDKNYSGETALQWAVMGKNDSLLNLLIENKANPNTLDCFNNSPLYYAICDDTVLSNHFPPFIVQNKSALITENLVKTLVKSGVDINQPNIEGNTPLLYATLKQDSLLVKILCRQGADPNISTEDGITPLMYATQDSSYNIAKLLIDYGANVNFTPKDGNTALFGAVRSNNDSIAKLLLKNKANVNEQNSNKETPLHYAVGYGFPLVTNLLLSYGANINLTDYNGNTPLMASVYSGALECTNLLIEANADVNKEDNEGNTPIMIAAQFNDTTLIKTLYYAGADLDKKNNRNSNALEFALHNNSADAFKMLLELGADVDSTNHTKSLYQQAYENGNTEIATILKNNNLNTKIKPSIEGINFYAGFTSSSSDFMLDFGTGIYEHLTRTMVNFGYKYRPHSSRILEYRDNNCYQFWEKRYSFYLSLQRLHGLTSFGNNKGNVGITYGCNGELTWRYLRGSDKSKTNFILAPNFGLYYQIGYCTVIGKWEIANYKSQGINFNRFGVQLLLNMPFSNKRVVNKTIYWLD